MVMKVNEWMAGLTPVAVSCVALLMSLTACGGGGGSSAPPPPEATVSAIGSAQLLRSTSNIQMSFPITMSKPVVNSVAVTYNTVALNQIGKTTPALGFAVAGTQCSAGVDYVTASNTITIPAGASSGSLPVLICGSTTLKADQTFSLQWSSGAKNGVQTGLIINTVAGGLASTATTTGLGGTPTFGRDTISLTNSNADGHLGLSYTPQPNSTNWQCTQDNVTGLIWQASPAINNGVANTGWSTYANLAAYVAQVNQSALCGYSNWRLPTANELESLVDFSLTAGAAADAFGFPVMQPDRYWSGEPRVNTTTDAWFVDFGNEGAVDYDTMTPPVSNAYTHYQVILVSAPAPVAAPCATADANYTDNGDGTVTDLTTQLMWKQCPEGAQGTGCEGTKIAFTSVGQITSEVTTVNQNAATTGLGYADWRVPTVKELGSLVIRSCAATTINTVAFPNTDAISHVTATVFAPNPSLLWVVDFNSGNVSPVNSASGGGYALRLVRAGQ